MVGWFEPPQLLNTALQALISTTFGRHSDRRLIEALARRDHDYYDYTCHYRELQDGTPIPDRDRPRESLWLDFVADVGDGWNSTHAIAQALSQPRLTVSDGAHEYATERADLLVMGGDEVYPTPSRQEYERRLIAPYTDAFGDAQPAERPHVFAIPGNHDWYDSLVAWSRLFCSSVAGRRFAGWRTRQARSYFALKLPRGWWLFGADGQLQSDIDVSQIEYFRGIALRHMQPGDRVILCLSSPSWVYAHVYERFGGYDESDLVYLVNEVFKPRGVSVQVFLSGDLHHYRRHEEIGAAQGADPVQKITAGGGGAFLHPTHGEDVSEIAEKALLEMPGRRFALRASFPPPAVSKRLVWGNLGFLFKNPLFGVLPATFYLFTAWGVGATVRWAPPRNLFDPLVQTARAFRDNPSVFLGFLTVVASFVFFTDTHSRVYKWAAGLVHAFAHYAALFYVGWGSAYVVYRAYPTDSLLQVVLGASLIFGLGWVVGSVLVGVYLLVSLGVFGRHSQEAFSSLRIEDYKHFLRLRIDADGSLTLYPIGIDRVARRWRERRDDERELTPSRFVPEDGSAPRLIEPPIRLSGRRSSG